MTKEKAPQKGDTMPNALDQVSFTEAPQRIFKNISEYKRVRANIIRALAKGKRSKNLKGDSYIFDRLKVDFSTRYKAEEIWLDHINGHIVLEAPMRKNESKESLQARRMEYHGQLLRQVEAMTSIGIATVYLLLDDNGRKDTRNNRKRNNRKRK